MKKQICLSLGAIIVVLASLLISCQKEDIGYDENDSVDKSSLILKSTAESQYLLSLKNIVQTLIDEGKITEGLGSSIISKIENALKSIEKGNLKGVNGQLGALINQIEDLIESGEVPLTDGESLIQSIETAENMINNDPIVQDGLIAYYPFNGNVLDESGNDQNGIAANLSFTANRGDVPNSSAFFNGEASVIIPPMGPIPSFSIAFWYKTSTTGVILNTDNIILNAEDFTYNGVRQVLFRTNWRHILSTGIAYYSPAGNPVYFDNTWHHVVVTHDAINERIVTYFDGNVRHNRPNSGYFAGNVANIFIGQKIHYVGLMDEIIKNFNGSIDDIYIFSRGITAEEVTLIYNYVD